MKLTAVALTVVYSLPILASASPLPITLLSKRIPVVNFLNNVLIFDSPAFQNPSDQTQTLASVEAFVFLPQINLNGITGALGDALSAVGLDVGDDISTAIDRLKLFAAVGVPRVTATVNADGGGCGNKPELVRTSLGDLGLTTSVVSFGSCSSLSETETELKVENDDFSTARLFPSGPDGFGVISDIDDTVKISNVLDKAKLLEATLFDDPTPVPGMPELYASLAQSLNDPAFLYVSGSPYQLYPFLHDFIDTTFSSSTGPILLRNITLANPVTLVEDLIEQVTANGDATLTYKVEQITRIQGMYPNKSFLAIGDSTEKDPEVYGTIFNTFGGDFIRCIWIHVVDGPDGPDSEADQERNGQARFDAAFQGVPQDRIRLYRDEDIAGLSNVDVAGGEC